MMDRARLHSVLTKSSRKIKLDKVTGTTPNSHTCKGDYFTMESVYWFQNVMKNVIILCSYYKFIHETKDKLDMDKIPFKKKDTKCIIYTHCRSNRPIWSMKILCTDSLGNTHPLKVDRNLQWMSHHPTNPTYNPELLGTMTHSSAWCLNSTTRTHNTNTYTQKVCIRYLTYCMPPLW